MNADEIRTKAIERVARWQYEQAAAETAETCIVWEDCHGASRRMWMRIATGAVDALGDLLPTATESNVFKITTEPGFARGRRYVTDWWTIEGTETV
jgi:hypothetical protein